MASQIRQNVIEKKIRRMRFGLIQGEDNYKQFLVEFERQYDCVFESIRMVDEILKKKDDSLSIYQNGIRIISYPDQNQSYEIEQILTKEFNNFFEYSYNLMKSLDNPTQLLLGLDYESMARIEIKNGMRVNLPHLGLNVLVYEYKNSNNQMVESGTNDYVAEFNFYYENSYSSSSSMTDGSRDKVIELEKIIEGSFKNRQNNSALHYIVIQTQSYFQCQLSSNFTNRIYKFAEINNNTKDRKGINDVKRLRPLLE